MPKLASCAAILAGGASSRMGQNKALLPLDGKPLIAHVADKLQAWFDQVVVITDTPEPYVFLDLPTTGDRVTGQGPLAGIAAALRVSRWPSTFISACDMPFLDEALVRHLVGSLGQHDAAIPQVSGRFEPLHAAYTHKCLAPVEAAMASGERKLQHLLQQLDLHVIEADELTRFGDPRLLLFNCNTPQDYEKLKG
jgi:molybdopterin-guanine dinucleotide biosynthesis protein A